MAPGCWARASGLRCRWRGGASGDDVARAAHLWSVAAVRHVLDLVERHQLACDLTPGGQLVVARDERAAEHQYQERQAALMLGLPPEYVEFVERDQLPPYAGRSLSGLRYGPAATLDPAALTEQLARAGERLGLVVHENSQVRRIRRGLLNTVVTDGGELVADHVVLAVNAYGGAPGGGAVRRAARARAGRCDAQAVRGAAGGAGRPGRRAADRARRGGALLPAHPGRPAGGRRRRPGAGGPRLFRPAPRAAPRGGAGLLPGPGRHLARRRLGGPDRRDPGRSRPCSGSTAAIHGCITRPAATVTGSP
ncbi:FAD-binding oxidoreductase [Streptomyces tricolor]|nr:FAD-binding oxidoreductase [Streptomyces tricolor]